MTESRQQKAEDASTRPARTGKLWKEKRAEGTSEDMQLSNLHLMWRWSSVKTQTGGGENQASVVRLPCHQHARLLQGPGGQLVYPESEQRDVDSKSRIYPY